MRVRAWWALGCTFGFVGVAGGAFGAHALEDLVTAERLATWGTGTAYMQMHALALIGLAVAGTSASHRALDVAGGCFTAGMVLFTGSLWLLVLLDLPILGAVTPLGGLCFLVGWVAALIGGWKAFSSRA